MKLVKSIKSIKFKRILTAILIPIAFMLTQISKNNIEFSEYYADNIYPIFAQAIGFFTGIVPFSVGEILLVLCIVTLLVSTTVTLLKTVKNKSWRHVKMFGINLLVVTSIIYFLFVIFCGMNYYRYQFTAYSGLEIKLSSKEELIGLCEVLVNRANELKSNLNSDGNGVTILADKNNHETSKRAQLSFNRISEMYPVLKGNYPKPKPVFFSRAMSYMQISGVYFPFTFESNVNIDIPYHQIPATMCHELSHIRGFMREDEANFISYLACTNSGYEDFEYSGVMLAMTYSMNALYSVDYDAFSQIYQTYSEGVRRDMAYVNWYWAQFETKIGEISSKMNDTYLKANNQDDGVKSYGRMVDLLLAEYRSKK